MSSPKIKSALEAIRKLPPGCLDCEIEEILMSVVDFYDPKFIHAKYEFGVGMRPLTFRNAANAIWNKLNIALSVFDGPGRQEQARGAILEARELADAIVHHEDSGNRRQRWTWHVNHFHACRRRRNPWR